MFAKKRLGRDKDSQPTPPTPTPTKKKKNILNETFANALMLRLMKRVIFVIRQLK